MASISSTSSSSSLGNTSLRGFGGMSSGIDRDSIIEQMTLGTTTKITNQKRKMTQLQWKQEAYRGVTDQILDLTDKYASYSSSSNLKDASAFAKSVITVHGKDESTKFVTATGTSQLVDNVSIKGVEQLATSAVTQSQTHISNNGLETNVEDLEKTVYLSNLEGAKLNFGTWNDVKKGWENTKTFTFASSYTDDDNKTHKIDYTDYTSTDEHGNLKLVNDLNELLKQSDIEFGEGNKISESLEFKYENGQIRLVETANSKVGSFVITNSSDSNVLKALGYEAPAAGNTTDGSQDAETEKHGITISELEANVKASGKAFEQTGITKQSTLDYLTGKKLTFNYDGSKKEVELITKEEADALKQKIDDYKTQNGDGTLTDEQKKELLGEVKNNLQSRLDKAFGNGNVTVSTENGGLSFNTKGGSSTISVLSNSYELLKNMGLEYGSSNKVNLDGKLSQSAIAESLKKDANGKVDFAQYTTDGTADGELDLEINGVKIKGLTTESSINDILSKINSTTEAGVKATYVDATGQFMLVASETGSGREISLNGKLANALFGGTEEKGFTSNDGQNAKIHVSYGNGVDVALERSSNTFNLEGLNVTVSGTFGVEKDADGKVLTDANGKVKFDSSAAVTFTAKADVDGAVEKVKSFFEDFNALVTEINNQITTRPDSDYQPLTDEQKAEMDETSIENWEKKAKQGMLYGDSAMRDLSIDVQAIFTKLMSNGASYEDLKEIGITYSEDYLDGGTLVFDEAAFRNAMESDPEKVSNIFTGGGNVTKGLINIVEDTFTPYATRYASKNGNSYGRLVEIAGTEKKPTSLLDNEIYKQLKDMQETIDKLNEKLKTEQDRYISQFTTMETLLNQMNTQSSYLSQLSA